MANLNIEKKALDWAQTLLLDITDTQPARHGDQSRTHHLKTHSGNFILKIATNLDPERKRLLWLEGKTLVPKVVDYISLNAEMDALLMTELPGKNLASLKKDWWPEMVVERFALAIRSFHEIDSTGCPFGTSGEGKLLVHGDACLPNLIFNSDQFSGYIDLGDMCIAAPEVDLSAAIWSLERNLGSGYGAQFLKAYGYADTSEETAEALRLKYEDARRASGSVTVTQTEQ